ncbi:alpha/beta hydrolase fold domain-containing protein [Nocardioides bruguierae]|uniref:Alpha/beta hydrolase n=1 Tax=Nocardioides bruguierae TaxID=2945102 RepID=A0A9X2D8H2_9ACTN|nr:alpha/beta hydrolase fold domain-containing protein [Nocardioides bruguierae]MCM0620747.1 alpha/beta hydrolase [Nocardioides bruguierae]
MPRFPTLPPLPDVVVPAFVHATRAQRVFATEQAAHEHVESRALRPAPFGPPPLLRRDVTVTAERVDGWPVYTVRPRSGSTRGAVVYSHGGGWVNEISAFHWYLVAQVAVEAATTVVVPIYPLVPFGTAAEVAEGVAALVRRTEAEHGPTSVAGDSAGGQISLSVAQVLRDAGHLLPATVLISPALDLSLSNPAIPPMEHTDPWLAREGGLYLAKRWAGDLPLDDPRVSPLFGDLAGLGPLTQFTGTRDILNPDARLLAEKAAAAGVACEQHEVEGQLHVYPLTPTKPGSQARARIVEVLRAAPRG